MNSAGVAVGGAFLDLTDEIWKRGFGPKLFGAVRMCQRFWPMLKEARGSVVNIAGTRGKVPAHDFMVNSAVNAALMNFTKALAGLGLVDDVNVNCVIPGQTKTDLHYDNLRQAAEMEGSTPEEVEKKRIAASGLRRFGEPEDIANFVAFLVSPWADTSTAVCSPSTEAPTRLCSVVGARHSPRAGMSPGRGLRASRP